MEPNDWFKYLIHLKDMIENISGDLKKTDKKL